MCTLGQSNMISWDLEKMGEGKPKTAKNDMNNC